MRDLFKYCCVIFWWLAGLSFATSQTVLDTVQLNEFEVTSEFSAAVSGIIETTIDPMLKNDLKHLSLAELLSANSAVFVKSYGQGGLATASMRGTGASHTRVLWNGFSINSPMLGQVDLSLIPNNFIDKVGLSAGGNSLLQTSGALGGSVNLSNKPFNSSDPLVSLSQAFGSFQTYVTSINLNLNSGKLRSDTRFNLQTSENDFLYYNIGIIPSDWMKQQHAAFRNIGFTQQFTYIPAKNHFLSIISWNQWNDRDIPPIMTNVQKGGNPDEFQQDFFSRNVITWSYNKGATYFELKSAVFIEDQHYFLQTTTNEMDADIVTIINSKNNSNGFFTKAKLVQELQNGFGFTVGSEIGINTVQSTNYHGQKQRNISSIYALAEKEIINRINISLLLRLELADEKLLPLLPMLSLNYQLLKNEKLYLSGSISKNYNLPTLNDLYWFPGGNENLKAESGLEIEAGLHYAKTFSEKINLTLGLTAYRSQITDWIQWTPTDYRYWSPENISDVYVRGLESSLQMAGTFAQLSYKFLAGYALNKTTVESPVAKTEGFAGTQLIYIPVHNANAIVFADYKGFSSSWSAYFIGQRTTTMDTEKNYSNTLPAYFLNDFSFGKKIVFPKIDMELRFKVNNIFNKAYQAILWRPMPGRYYELFFTFNIN